MKKVLFVLLAIAAMAGTAVEAKPIPKSLVGCWSFSKESEPQYAVVATEVDTFVTCYSTKCDSIVLCKDGNGMLAHRVTNKFVAHTEDGFEALVVHEYEYVIRFKWSYHKGEVCIPMCYPDISSWIKEQYTDNRGVVRPTKFEDYFDEEMAVHLITLLPNLELEFNPETGRLYSNFHEGFFTRCEGKPFVPSNKPVKYI